MLYLCVLYRMFVIFASTRKIFIFARVHRAFIRSIIFVPNKWRDCFWSPVCFYDFCVYYQLCSASALYLKISLSVINLRYMDLLETRSKTSQLILICNFGAGDLSAYFWCAMVKIYHFWFPCSILLLRKNFWTTKSDPENWALSFHLNKQILIYFTLATLLRVYADVNLKSKTFTIFP